MADRALLQGVLQDADGDVLPLTAVTVVQEDGTTPFAGQMYTAASGGTPTTVFQSDSAGLVKVYTDVADRALARVKVGSATALTPLVAFLPSPEDIIVQDNSTLAQVAAGLKALHASASVPALEGKNSNASGPHFRLRNSSDDVIVEALDAAFTLSQPLRFNGIAGVLGWFDIADYGALPGLGNAAATTTAITAALADLVAAGGGTLYIPTGLHYDNLNRSVTAAVPFFLRGAGPGVSQLLPTTVAGDYLTISGPVFAGISDLSITPSVGKTSTTWAIRVHGASGFWMDRVYAVTSSGGCIQIDTCVNAHIDRVWAASIDAGTGDTALWVKAACVAVSNCLMQTGSTLLGRGPTVRVTGTLNSSRFVNCIFGNGGPVSSMTMSSIADNGATFAVATPIAHGLAVDDIVVLRNTGVAAYNGQWRVSAIGSATLFSVTPAAPLGAGNVVVPVGDCVQTVGATFYIDNALGAYNEAVVTGCLFTRTTTALYGTASVYADGKRSGLYEINGWGFENCWYDFGTTAIILSGRNISGVNGTYGYRISGGFVAGWTRGIHLDQVCGVIIEGVSTFPPVFAPVDDTFSDSAAIYVYGGSGAPFTTGITIVGNHIGMPRDHAVGGSGYGSKYGILLDKRIDSLLVTGNQILGTVAPVASVNSAVADERVWKIQNNLSTTALPMTADSTQPEIASAASIAPGIGFESCEVTGTTTITTITNAWQGRTLRLLFTGALTLGGGGNVSPAAGRTILANSSVELVFKDTTWYVR